MYRASRDHQQAFNIYITEVVDRLQIITIVALSTKSLIHIKHQLDMRPS